MTMHEAPDEPLSLIAAWIGFDAAFYRSQSRAAAADQFAHFCRFGRFENRQVRAFDPDALRRAVRFTPDAYCDLHPDVRAAGIDPWKHFLQYGLHEHRVTVAYSGEEAGPEVWDTLGLDATHRYAPTLGSKMVVLGDANRSRMVAAVFAAIHDSRLLLYHTERALLLAKLCLLIGWPVAAEVFLSAHRTGLPFGLPETMVRAPAPHVFAVMSLRQYCQSRGLPWRSAGDPTAAGGVDGAGFVPLVEALVCGATGDVVTADNVVIAPGVWDRLVRRGAGDAMDSPHYRVLHLQRRATKLDGTAVALTPRGPAAVTCLVDAMPRLLCAVAAGAFATSNQAKELPGGAAGRSRLATWGRRHLGRKLRAALHSVGNGAAAAPALLVRAELAEPLALFLPALRERGIGSPRLVAIGDDEDVRVDALIATSDPHDPGDADAAGEPPASVRLNPAALARVRNALLGSEPAPMGAALFLRSGADEARGPVVTGSYLEGPLNEIGFETHRFDATALRGPTAERLARASLIVVASMVEGAGVLLAPRNVKIVTLGVGMPDRVVIETLAAAVDGEVLHVPGVPLVPPPGSGGGLAYVDKAELIATLRGLLDDDVRHAMFQRRAALICGEAGRIAATPDAALSLLEREGTQLVRITEPYGLVAVSRPLDGLCAQIGGQVLADLPPSPAPRPGVRLYYATALLLVGGHTRLLEALVAARPNDEHYVLCSALPEVGAGYGPDLVLRSAQARLHVLQGTPGERLAAAFRLIGAIRPETLFHLAHPDDPVGAAVLQPGVAGRIVMIHHNDHCFAFGRTLPGLHHVTLHPRSQAQIDALLGVSSTLLPLTSASPGGPVRWSGDDEPLITATSGSQAKFQARGGRRYADLLLARFAAREGTHVHIGLFEPDFRAELLRTLTSAGCADRFIDIPFTPDLAALIRAVRPHLYLNSYPVGGGLALVAAMAAGIPISSSKHDAVLDSTVLAYPQNLSWKDLGDFQNILRNYTIEDREKHGLLAYSYYRAHHSPDRFSSVLDAIITGATAAKAI